MNELLLLHIGEMMVGLTAILGLAIVVASLIRTGEPIADERWVYLVAVRVIAPTLVTGLVLTLGSMFM